MKKGQLIIIDGTTSITKTNICKAMQHQLDTLHVILGLDQFSQLIPPKQKSNESAAIMANTFLNDVMFSSYKAICTYLDEGIPVISDQFFWNQEWFYNALHLFSPYEVFYVGIHVSETINNPYPKLKTTNHWNKHSAHNRPETMIYDFELDSTNLSPDEAAQQIMIAYQNIPNPTAFKGLAQRFL
ncbi:MAG: phosphotransferase-like protein [Legionella sp.]